MGMIKYLGSLIKNDTGNSSKSFALVSSTVLSFIIGLCIGSVIVYDGFRDGVIDTDLEKAGIFMICVGSCIAASGVPKIFGERAEGRHRCYYPKNGEEKMEDE
jgi:hypothetical protein